MTTTPTASAELPDLDKLEALARAATPGPWAYQEESDAYTHIVRPTHTPGRIVRQYAQDTNGVVEANARFTAGANPAAVLGLIALARRAALANQPAPTVPARDALAGRVKSSTPGLGIIEVTLDGDVPEWLDPGHTVTVTPGAHQPAQEQAEPVADKCSRCSDHAVIYVEGSTVPCPACQVVDDDDDAAQQEPVAAPADDLTDDDRQLVARGMEHLRKGVAGECRLPPAGWHCTRTPGHDGPCAAEPVAAPQQAAAPGEQLWLATLRACGELPEGYEVRIELENGCGMVVWYDDRGERHVIDGEGYLYDDVNEAIDLAIQRAAAPKGGA